MAGILPSCPRSSRSPRRRCVSYLRLQPQHWSGAMQCWGTENREAALRFVAGVTRGDRRLAPTWRSSRSTAPRTRTWRVGAVLAAGLARPRGGRSTAAVDRGGSDVLLAADVQEARGIRQLPASLPEAADELAASSVLREAMGDFLFETFLATRRGEAEQYEGLDDDELIRSPALAVLSGTAVPGGASPR